jgi:hypothetical protein
MMSVKPFIKESMEVEDGLRKHGHGLQHIVIFCSGCMGCHPKQRAMKKKTS